MLLLSIRSFLVLVDKRIDLRVLFPLVSPDLIQHLVLVQGLALEIIQSLLHLLLHWLLSYELNSFRFSVSSFRFGRRHWHVLALLVASYSCLHLHDFFFFSLDLVSCLLSTDMGLDLYDFLFFCFYLVSGLFSSNAGLNLDYFLFILLMLLDNFLLFLKLLSGLITSDSSLHLSNFLLFLFNLLPCFLSSNMSLDLNNLLLLLLNLLPGLMPSETSLDLGYLIFLPILLDITLKVNCCFHLLKRLQVFLALQLLVSVRLDWLRADLLLGEVISV